MFGLLRSARSMASRTLGNSIGNGIEKEWGSPNLRNLAQQLRFYQRPHAPWCSDNEADESGEGGGGVSSHLGVLESVAVTSNSELSVARKRAKRAAVLVCLFEGSEGDLRVILTQRSGNLSSHSGEVALPGGKMEERDKDDAETALREAKEEIGLDPSHVKVVTTLEPFLSKYLLRVVPVVGLLPDRKSFKPVINPGEVDAIFDAPLEMFLKYFGTCCFCYLPTTAIIFRGGTRLWWNRKC
uniref:Nudix hydrolase domain-containing protein n=1 Tax=Picea sitchensis TaxID=3332 RepID=A9NLA9_PICSI|nr:unknown [Picea sitchensis]